MSTPHELVNPEHMPPAKGFSHAVVAAPGRVVYVAGQVAAARDGTVVSAGFAEQYEIALGNVVSALAAAGGSPEHIVSMIVYTTAMQEYRDSLRDVGAAHRLHLGRHFPAMAMLGVTELFDPAAKLEIVATAVIP